MTRLLAWRGWYLLGLTLLAVPGPVTWAATFVVAWDWPTQYEDGTPIAAGELTEMRVQLGTCLDAIPTFGVMSREKLVAYPGNTSTFSNLSNGTYCIRAFARAGDGESDASNVIFATIINKPQAPKLR